MLLAAGAVRDDSAEHDVLVCRAARDSEGLASARKAMQTYGLLAIRERALQICVAMHALDLDALRMCAIVAEACAPFAAQLDFHLIWNLVVKVRHFQVVDKSAGE